MSDRSAIEWTDATWNPTRGCARVSPGCANCYAERFAHRFSGKGQRYEGLTKQTKAGPRWTGVVRLADEKTLTQPLDWKKPRRIFVESMSDLFHESVDEFSLRLIFDAMAICQQHTFQVLTKRPERMKEWVSSHQWVRSFEDRNGLPSYITYDINNQRHRESKLASGSVPYLPNVWLGTSVENQEWANRRVPALRDTPAAVRFLSCEPLLGQINLRGGIYGFPVPGEPVKVRYCGTSLEGGMGAIHWVIVGGESGPGARPMHPDWARNLRDQCASAGVAFFFKQWGQWAPWTSEPTWKVLRDERIVDIIGGENTSMYHRPQRMHRAGKKLAGRLLDGREHNEFPQPQAIR